MGDRTKVEERGGHPESSLGGGRPGSGRTSCTVDYVGWRPLALGGLGSGGIDGVGAGKNC